MSVWKDPSAKNAFVLSVVSVLFTLIAAFIGIAYYMTTGSSLTLVFGLENIVVRCIVATAVVCVVCVCEVCCSRFGSACSVPSV